MIIKCPECGHEVSDRAKTCPSCGIDIEGNVVRDPKSGEYILKPGKKEKKGGHALLWSSIAIGALLAMAIVGLGIFFYQKTQQENEMRAFENALTSKEPAVLQNYLDMHVDAPAAHRDSVKAHLLGLQKIERDWQNAVASKSKSALQLFVDRNPENIHVREARLIIDSLDFEVAKLDDTMEAYQKYMTNHLQGSYYDEAANAYDRLKEEAEARKRKAEQDSLLLNMGERVGE